MSNAVTNQALPITLQAAVEKYGPPLTVEMLRSWCRRGELRCARVGKHLMIDPDELAERLRPRPRAMSARSARETPSQREARQLAEAGIGAK